MMTVPMFFLVVDVSLLMSLVLTQSFADGRVGLDYFLMASAENIGFDQNLVFDENSIPFFCPFRTAVACRSGK
jgi:hypothetical protein